MTTLEQPEMEGESLDSPSCKGKLFSFKSMPTSSLSVIYAPFTYPLSSLLLIPPLNSLVNIKEQASHLAHPLARLGHASQIFSSEKVKSPPRTQEAENWSLDDQACNAYSLKASLKPPVGAVVNSLTTIRTDIVDKVCNLRTGVEDRVAAAREKVTTFKTGVEYQVHTAREQVNLLATGVEYQVHSAKEQVTIIRHGVEDRMSAAKDQVNTAVDRACSVPLLCYTSSKDIATAYINLAIVTPFAIYASTKDTAFTFADQATIYAASFSAAQYALSVSDSGLGKTEMLLGLVPGERVERVQMKVKKVRITARQVRERARRAARRRSSEQSEFDVQYPDQKELFAVSLEIMPGEMADENATLLMVLFVMLVLLMLIVLMLLVLVLEDALENTLEEAKLGDAIVDVVGFSYILTLLSFFGISFPDFSHAVKEQEAQAALREEKRCKGN